MGNRKSLAAESSDQPSTWVDLAVYLVAGIGSFFLTTYLAGQAMSSLAGKWTMLYSVTIWSLSIICLGGTFYILGVRCDRITWSGIGLVPISWRWRWLLVGSLVMAIAFPVRVLLANWIRERLVWNPIGVSDEGLSGTSLIIGESYSFSWSKFTLALFGMGAFVPVAEELYFRGLIHS